MSVYGEAAIYIRMWLRYKDDLPIEYVLHVHVKTCEVPAAKNDINQTALDKPWQLTHTSQSLVVRLVQGSVDNLSMSGVEREYYLEYKNTAFQQLFLQSKNKERISK